MSEIPADSFAVTTAATTNVTKLPAATKLLTRGLTRRCPWCGDFKAYFLGWFKRQDECRRCDKPFRRGDEAFELGAITANVILTFGLILGNILIFIVATVPDIPVTTIMITGGVIGILGPVIFYPVSFTLWQAIDLIMRRPTKAELQL